MSDANNAPRFRVETAEDILKEAAADREKLKHRRAWGDWKLRTDILTLTYDDGRFDYEIDLERCCSSAEVLDWIFQFDNKTWSGPVATGDLIHALRDIINPQATLCSFGRDKTLDVASWVKRRFPTEDERKKA